MRSVIWTGAADFPLPASLPGTDCPQASTRIHVGLFDGGLMYALEWGGILEDRNCGIVEQDGS